MNEDEPGYVEVRDEPFHRHCFENEWVRAYDVLIPAGATSLYHRHAEDTFYAIVHEVRLRDQVFGQEPTGEGTVPEGLSMCRPHRSDPLIHRVTNLGENPARMIGAEVKDAPGVRSDEALEAPGHALIWEVERLRAYRLVLEPGEETGPLAYPFASLTVAMTRASLETREGGTLARTASVAEGEMAWRGDAARLRLRNVGPTAYHAILVEWR